MWRHGPCFGRSRVRVAYPLGQDSEALEAIGLVEQSSFLKGVGVMRRREREISEGSMDEGRVRRHDPV